MSGRRCARRSARSACGSIRCRLSVIASRSRACAAPSENSALGRYIIIGTTGLSSGTAPLCRARQRAGPWRTLGVAQHLQGGVVAGDERGVHPGRRARPARPARTGAQSARRRRAGRRRTRARTGGVPRCHGGIVWRGSPAGRAGACGLAGGHACSWWHGRGELRYWTRVISACVEEARSRASQVTRGVSGSRSRASRTLRLGEGGRAVELVDGDGVGQAVLLQHVHHGEGLLQPPGVGQHQRAQRAVGHVPPQPGEALLPGRAEQVEHQVVAEGEPAEVHGDGGGGLVLGAPARSSIRRAGLRHRLLGAQRRISDRVPTSVVLPTAKCPTIRIFTARSTVAEIDGLRRQRRARSPSSTSCSSWMSGTRRGRSRARG